MLHDWLGDPVDLGVSADGLVERINHDHFEVLVGRVLEQKTLNVTRPFQEKYNRRYFPASPSPIPAWLRRVNWRN